MIANNEEDLGTALDEDVDEIELRGELARKIKKICQMEQIVWSLCLLCLAVVVATLLISPMSGGTSLALSLAAGTPAAVAMGVPTAATAVLTAAAGGGIHVLKKLRKRTIKEISKDHIVLIIPKTRKGRTR